MAKQIFYRDLWRRARFIPRSVWALGFVSLLMDTSSELIHSLLPVFMVSSLGASKSLVGLVEGVAESTALIVRVFSGFLSDYLRKRKLLALFGYGLSALSKFIFPLISSVTLFFIARFVDRVGKGIRSAPRDALISEIAPQDLKGACFGLQQALDTVGAFLGPLIAVIGLAIFAGNVRQVLWLAVIPAVLCMIILVVWVDEPARPPLPKDISKDPSPRFNVKGVYELGPTYYSVLLVGTVFSLARFSGAFLILKAVEVGVPLLFIPMVLIGANVVYALAAYPAGELSDQIGRKGVLSIGIGLLVAANFLLGMTHSPHSLILGVTLWGMHFAFSEGILSALVSDFTVPHLRGIGYGMLGLTSGLATFISSVVAGMVWDVLGSQATFFVGAIVGVGAFFCTIKLPEKT